MNGRWMRMLGVVWLSLALSGCATVGRPFAADSVGRIEIGKTTQDDVRRLFGPPWRTGVEDGDVTWTYGHYRYRLFGRARTQDLVVRFDAQKIVSSYTFNTTEHDEKKR